MPFFKRTKLQNEMMKNARWICVRFHSHQELLQFPWEEKSIVLLTICATSGIRKSQSTLSCYHAQSNGEQCQDPEHWHPGKIWKKYTKFSQFVKSELHRNFDLKISIDECIGENSNDKWIDDIDQSWGSRHSHSN